MTTVTLVTGDQNSGRRLVGMAVAAHIRRVESKNTFAVDNNSRLKPINFADTNKLDDLFLISSSDKIEKWMKPWIKEYGDPLFTIHITRHRKDPE